MKQSVQLFYVSLVQSDSRRIVWSSSLDETSKHELNDALLLRSVMEVLQTICNGNTMDRPELLLIHINPFTTTRLMPWLYKLLSKSDNSMDLEQHCSSLKSHFSDVSLELDTRFDLAPSCGASGTPSAKCRDLLPSRGEHKLLFDAWREKCSPHLIFSQNTSDKKMSDTKQSSKSQMLSLSASRTQT